MHPSTRYILAGVGAAAIIAAANAHPDVSLKPWIQDTPVAPILPCPSKDFPSIKTFTYNEKVYEWCFIDGPYKWDGKQWYVQRLKQIGKAAEGSNPAGPWSDVIRVCSPQAVGHEGMLSPCGAVGPGGCKNCKINGMPVN
jgi:hypothetical protein